ncbi:MAG: hypothetical protein J3K34DRAFT_516139 [Monoraphidium minutum]|nr:MAG: hypothetical protein J3K34DRAFT_516139 [Monoraphidium minutum]
MSSSSDTSSIIAPEPLLQCPICLSDTLDRAVVMLCCHAFCRACIQEWSRMKRVCPLCKGRISGYRYDIRSDEAFQEVLFPPTPPPAAAADAYGGGGERSARRGHGGSGGGRYASREAAAAAYARGVIEAFGGPVDDAYYEGPRGEARHRPRVERGYRRGDADERPAHPRRGDGGGGGSGGGSGAAGGGSGREEGVQPRPYYYRMQHHMLSSVNRGPADASGAVPPAAAPPPPPADPRAAAAARRRAAYERAAWADPSSVAPPARAAPRPAPHGPSSPRLVEWVERELEGLLPGGTGGTAVVAAFALGQARAFGLERDYAAEAAAGGGGGAAAAGGGARIAAAMAHESATRGGGAPRGAAAAAARAGSSSGGAAAAAGGGARCVRSPVAALEPFLFEHAAQFWHEMRVFAQSGLSLQAYDARVRYTPAAAGGGAGGGCASRAASPAPSSVAVAEGEWRDEQRRRPGRPAADASESRGAERRGEAEQQRRRRRRRWDDDEGRGGQPVQARAPPEDGHARRHHHPQCEPQQQEQQHYHHNHNNHHHHHQQQQQQEEASQRARSPARRQQRAAAGSAADLAAAWPLWAAEPEALPAGAPPEHSSSSRRHHHGSSSSRKGKKSGSGRHRSQRARAAARRRTLLAAAALALVMLSAVWLASAASAAARRGGGFWSGGPSKAAGKWNAAVIVRFTARPDPNLLGRLRDLYASFFSRVVFVGPPLFKRAPKGLHRLGGPRGGGPEYVHCAGDCHGIVGYICAWQAMAALAAGRRGAGYHGYLVVRDDVAFRLSLFERLPLDAAWLLDGEAMATGGGRQRRVNASEAADAVAEWRPPPPPPPPPPARWGQVPRKPPPPPALPPALMRRPELHGWVWQNATGPGCPHAGRPLGILALAAAWPGLEPRCRGALANGIVRAMPGAGDMYYIPSGLAQDFGRVASHLHSHNVHADIATPLILDCLGPGGAAPPAALNGAWMPSAAYARAENASGLDALHPVGYALPDERAFLEAFFFGT